jgi:hypothetical protein
MLYLVATLKLALNSKAITYHYALKLKLDPPQSHLHGDGNIFFILNVSSFISTLYASDHCVFSICKKSSLYSRSIKRIVYKIKCFYKPATHSTTLLDKYK